MSERDKDRADLEESRKAVAAAEAATVEADMALISLHEVSENIRSLVDRNGYVDRFRAVIRGVA